MIIFYTIKQEEKLNALTTSANLKWTLYFF